MNGIPGSFLLALLLTEIIEGSLILLYGRWRRQSLWPLLGLVLLLNAITQPLLWVALLWRGATAYWPTLLVMEALIWLLEGVGFYLYWEKKRLAWGMSLWLNGASFGIGLLLPV